MTLSVWTITRKSLITKYAVVMLARATRRALLQILANILEGEFMSSIGNFEAARALVTQPGSLLEVGQVDVAGQSLLGYVNAPSSMRDLWMLATWHGEAEYMVYLDERMTYQIGRAHV